jgi:hypothetical protein
MKDDRRREVVDATLEALRHTVGRDEHMPHLHAIVAGRVGPVTFAEIAEALASVDVSGRDPEWLADWADLIEMIRRAARRSGGEIEPVAEHSIHGHCGDKPGQ